MPTKYIHFTDEQKEQARRTDLADLLRSQGEALKRSGSEYEWRDGSQKVTIRGNLWFHQYEQKGGDAIDFVRRFYNKSYPEAMVYLLGGASGVLTVSPPIEKKTAEPFVLPEKNDNMRRVYAYLMHHRGVDRDVLYAFAHKGMIYESAEYHNAVFVGYDAQGNAAHANLRGTGSESTFKGNVPGSRPEYSFHWTGSSDKLYLFEAPIDMLSYISMHKDGWQKHSYAACCGVSDRVMLQMLQDDPNIKTVCLCLDNDEAGWKADKRIADKLFTQGIQTEILVPIHKDWNEDLLFPEESEVEDECRVLQL